MRGIPEELPKLVEGHAKAGEYDYVFARSGLSTSPGPFLLHTKHAAERGISAKAIESKLTRLRKQLS